MKRTIYCGLVREAHIGTDQRVAGWVLNKRDMGGVIFIDLRDREGVVQVVFDAANLTAEDFAVAESLKNQSVISALGAVRLRDAETVNPRIATGTVEVMASSLELLSQCDQLPFSPEDNQNTREDLRLKYRYIDLRRPSMYHNLKTRAFIQRTVEQYLDEQGFLCVETPMLCKSTPEGARDYLVPSRVHPGSFYALPQSPQIYKQLLMVGGIDRYYQVARCFRDEDLRADRQPEFTQVDMEMSFVEQEDVLVHLEGMFKDLFYKVKGIDIKEPFQRITWHEAMDKYGSDKPDLRFDLPIVDVTDLAAASTFSVFNSVTKQGGVVRAICVPGAGEKFARTDIDNLTEAAISFGAKGMAWILLRADGTVNSILPKYFTDEGFKALLDRLGAKAGDFILFSADKLATVRKVLGALRLNVADMLGLRHKDEYKFLFVTDFPQFEYSEEEDRFVATHHPFTMPYPEDVQYLLTDKARVRAQAYDVVLNGVELGSGSVRIHNRDVQKVMFEALGFSNEEIEDRFGFMVGAFRYGTPPHAGFAFGLDRFVMLMVGADSLREVIAFPKIKDASCPMTDAPTPVDASQLEVLGLGKALEESVGGKTGAKKAAPTIDVEKIADLARLSLSGEEKARVAKDMGAIIGFADQLSAVDTAGVAEATYVVDLKNVLREDEPENNFERDALLANAKTKAEGYVTVPRVVEG
ncbi:MAG: aspartate--tRNA ligase [Clostridia bacterium]|nr:aspartate--tRNA ligase [Clostridia bacterium]